MRFDDRKYDIFHHYTCLTVHPKTGSFRYDRKRLLKARSVSKWRVWLDAFIVGVFAPEITSVSMLSNLGRPKERD